eukprot:2594328-Amphidinium_carterae.1
MPTLLVDAKKCIGIHLDKSRWLPFAMLSLTANGKCYYINHCDKIAYVRSRSVVSRSISMWNKQKQ